MRALVLLLCSVIAAAQSTPVPAQDSVGVSAPLELDGTPQRAVLVTAREVIRAADDPLPDGLSPLQRAMQARGRIYNNMISVGLSVVLNLNGRVESAKAISGPRRFYDQAVALEEDRVFEPVRDSQGTIVRAHFTDYVSIAPPEQWLGHAPQFPADIDLRTFRISLERTGCFGSCPAYKVIVSGLGGVSWEGGPNLAVPGTHHSTISRQAVQELVDQVRTSRMLSALDRYEAGWTDSPTYTLTLDVNGLHKKVVDYIGIIVGMPTSISELEGAIDRIAGTEKWIKGNAELIPALAAEHWNFAADSKDNLLLYDGALARGDRNLMVAFTAVRAPIFSADPAVASPVCAASALSDSNQALEMLATVPKGRRLPQHALDECLTSAAKGGNLEMVNLWLKRGASLTPAPPPQSGDDYIPPLEYPLIAAVQGGAPEVVQALLDAHAPVDPEHDGGRNLLTFAVVNCRARSFEDNEVIVKMLLDAGADPNAETERDKPALFLVNSAPRLVPLLVDGGAKVNERDSQGNTPLMASTNPEALRALLKAGADPTLRNRQGKTPAEWFRAEGLKEQADLLDAAAKAR